MADDLLFEKEVGNRARQARESLGQTQEQLAEKTNLSVSTIYNFENGVKNSTLQTFNAICEALEVSPLYLLKGSTDEEQELRKALKKIDEIHQILTGMVKRED